MRKKSDLPVKICHGCQRPMVWRKAWEKVWDDVKYCSDRCRKAGPALKVSQASGPQGSTG